MGKTGKSLLGHLHYHGFLFSSLALRSQMSAVLEHRSSTP